MLLECPTCGMASQYLFIGQSCRICGSQEGGYPDPSGNDDDGPDGEDTPVAQSVPESPNRRRPLPGERPTSHGFLRRAGGGRMPRR